jgi:uncharacterized membrane protein YozB (DUF420 family)
VSNLTPSEKYGIAAAVALIAMVLVNNAILMLVLSLAGIGAGIWVIRKGEVRRVAFVGFVAFIMAAVFAVIGLVGAA